MSWSSQRNTAYGSTEFADFCLPHTDTTFRAYYDGSGNVKIVKSTDGGYTYGAAVTIEGSLTNGDLMLNDPICYDSTVGANGRLFVCYGNHIDQSATKAVLKIGYSDDLGATWTTSTLDDGTSHSGTNQFYRVAVWAFNGTISLYYTYVDASAFTNDGLWRNLGTYTTGTITWGGKSAVYASSGYHHEPSLYGFTDGTVVLVSVVSAANGPNAGDIEVARSLDGGTTWDSSMTAITSSADCGRSRLRGENGTWFIVANKPFNAAPKADTYLWKSTDNAVTFDAGTKVISNNGSADTSHPDIALEGTFAAIIVNDIGGGGGHRLVTSTDTGGSWSSASNPFGDASTNSAPRLIVTKSFLLATGYDSVNSRTMWAMNPQWFAPQPFFRSVASAGTAGSGTLTINVPSGVTNGDQLFLVVSVSGASHVPAPGASWTLVSSEATGPSVGVWKRTASSEPASYSISVSALSGGAIIAYQNVAGTAIDVNGSQNRAASGTTVTASSVTTTKVMDLLVFIAECAATGISVTTDPTAFDRRVNFVGTNGGLAYVADTPQIASGASGSKTATLSGAGGPNDGILIALAGLTTAAPSNSVAPAITGTVSNGSTLTSTAGTWTNSPVYWKYQWQTSSDGSSWSSVTNATLPFFKVTDGTKYHLCQVTACNEVGCSSASNSNSISPQATGTIGTLTLSSPTGTAAGGAAVSATIGTLTLSAPSATGTGGSTATGNIGTLTLSGPGGSAGSSAVAFGTIGTLTLSAPTASVTGDAAVNGAIPTLNLSSPRATATGGTIGSFVIGGQIETGSISPPTHARPALVKEPA